MDQDEDMSIDVFLPLSWMSIKRELRKTSMHLETRKDAIKKLETLMNFLNMECRQEWTKRGRKSFKNSVCLENKNERI